MSEDNKSPFGEKTVVAGSVPTEEPAAEHKPMSAEKTMVFAQSNLKETFDARTIVRSSKPAPNLPNEAPPKVAEVKVPPAEFPVAVAPSPSMETSPGIRTDSVTDEPVPGKPKLSSAERRAARAALDRRTRTTIAAFAAVCVMAVLCFFFAAGSKSDKPAVADDVRPVSKTNLASEKDELTPGMKKAQQLSAQGSYKTTTDVLSDFDRAAKRAQDHALEYSR